MSKDDEIRRGHRAEAILKDDLFVEAWDAVRAKLISIMETAKTDEATLHAKTCLGLLADVRQHSSRVMVDGKVATESIKLEKEQRSWWQRAA